MAMQVLQAVPQGEHEWSLKLASPPVDVELQNEQSLIVILKSGESRQINLPGIDRVDEEELKLVWDRGSCTLTLTVLVHPVDEILVTRADVAHHAEYDDSDDNDSDDSDDNDSDDEISSEPQPPRASHQLTPTIFRHAALQLTALEGRGFGFVATNDIHCGERILAERSLMYNPELDKKHRDGRNWMSMLVQMAGSGKDLDQLILDTSQSVPLHISAQMESEAKQELEKLDVQPSMQVVRLYFVLKFNAMEGGLYPHTARINHSCKPNCRFVYREGQVDVWARQHIPKGAEVTISYRATDHFSGMPWDLFPARQQQLFDAYDFRCECSLCTQGTAGLESVLCHACGSEIRPANDGAVVACQGCGVQMGSTAIYKGASKLIDLISMSERKFVATQEEFAKGSEASMVAMSPIFDAMCRVEDMAKAKLHPHHVALYKCRALICKIGGYHHIQDGRGRRRLLEDNDFCERILSSLTAMDAAAVGLFCHTDLIRQPILGLMRQALQVQALHSKGHKRKGIKAAIKTCAREKITIIDVHGGRDWSDKSTWPEVDD